MSVTFFAVSITQHMAWQVINRFTPPCIHHPAHGLADNQTAAGSTGRRSSWLLLWVLGRSPTRKERLLVLSGNVQEGSRWVYNVKAARSQDRGLAGDPVQGSTGRQLCQKRGQWARRADCRMIRHESKLARRTNCCFLRDRIITFLSD